MKKLKELIEEIIRNKEKELGTKLTIEDFDFVSKTAADFVLDYIHKFINGTIEHNDSSFLQDVDHLSEARNELLDLLSYLTAAKIKMRRYDERYK